MDTSPPAGRSRRGGDLRSARGAFASGDVPPDPPALPGEARGRTEWGIGEWLLWLVGSYIVTIIVGGLVGAGSVGGTPPRVVLVFGALLPACFLTAAAWALTHRSERPVAEVIQAPRGGRRLASDVGIGFLVGFGLQILIGVIFTLFDVSVDQQIGDDLQRIVGVQRALLVVLVAVMAPLGEELFFRVLLYDALRRRLPVVWAVVLQGAAFGLVHVQPWVALPALAVAGVAFGTLFARGRSLWCCVAAHLAFNSLAVIDLLA